MIITYIYVLQNINLIISLGYIIKTSISRQKGFLRILIYIAKLAFRNILKYTPTRYILSWPKVRLGKMLQKNLKELLANLIQKCLLLQLLGNTVCYHCLHLCHSKRPNMFFHYFNYHSLITFQVDKLIYFLAIYNCIFHSLTDFSIGSALPSHRTILIR